MSDSDRPIKLKLKTSGLSQQSSGAPASAAPQSTTSAVPKIKLFNKAIKVESTQDAETVASPKLKLNFKPKKPKPEQAATGSEKRKHDKVEHDGAVSAPGKKKLKLSLVKKAVGAQHDEPQSATITTPYVRFKGLENKFKKKAKLRQKGYAYDSEASDRELDPVQQWNFILRMPPGEDAEWVRERIEKRELEANKKSFRLRFLQEDGRRAMLTVRSKTYAAILVDLPCIVESMKGWDKKGWWKSADIHQMLLVLGTVMSEEEALTYPLPKAEVNETTWAYAHGLTPPMHWVRKRRFRSRISTHAIQNIEESVRKLLDRDEAAIGDVQYEVLDRDELRRQDERRRREEQRQLEAEEDEDGEGEYEEEYEEDDAEAEIEEEEEDEDLEAQFESFLGAGDEDDDAMTAVEAVGTPASSSAAALDPHHGTDSEADTPAAGAESRESSDDDDDDEDEDDSDKEERAGIQRARVEINELEAAIKEQLGEMERVANPLLKARIKSKIQTLQADLELKKAAIGDEDDD